MAVPLTRFPWCWWGNNEKDAVSNGPSVNSLPDWGFGFKDQDNLKFRSITAAKKMASSKVKRKWKSREERRRVDKEYDVVLVPSDGVCLSGSESDDSDWSIGWLEPLAPDFQSDDDSDDGSFAVIVPCYRHHDYHQDMVDMEPKNHLLCAIQNLPYDYSAEGKKYMEQCLAYLRDF